MRENDLDAQFYIHDSLAALRPSGEVSAKTASYGDGGPSGPPARPPSSAQSTDADRHQFDGEDTIVALSTGLGKGAIGIVRMSGPEAYSIAARCVRPAGGSTLPEESHRFTYAHVVDPLSGEILDEVLVALMLAPRTYTREDVVEVNCHGGPAAQRAVLRLLVQLGARIADPGEFTKRAFLNGRIDLAQAESVAAIVSARSSGALRVSMRQLEGGLSRNLRELRRKLIAQLAMIEATVDFSDEDVDDLDWDGLAAELDATAIGIERLLRTSFLGKALEEGVRTAIIGRPNVGKSSLLNALLMRERAIVSDIPGTTRDTIEELTEIGGIPIQLVDTAGVRSGGDKVEQLGVQRSFRAMNQSDLVLAVFDLSLPWSGTDTRLARRLDAARSIVVGNKRDLVSGGGESSLLASLTHATGQREWRVCPVSARTGEGLDELRRLVTQLVAGDEALQLEEPVLTTERQRRLVEEALQSSRAACRGAIDLKDEELICEDIRQAAGALGRITGEDLTADLLDEIFSRFCLGK